MIAWFRRFLLPGFVFQSMCIAGGYGTGRELVEFFLRFGPAGGLQGMIPATLVVSAGCIVAFELARMTKAFDYRSFLRILLGPGRPHPVNGSASRIDRPNHRFGLVPVPEPGHPVTLERRIGQIRNIDIDDAVRRQRLPQQKFNQFRRHPGAGVEMGRVVVVHGECYRRQPEKTPFGGCRHGA